VNQNVPALQSYRGIMPDVCNEDGLDASNTQFAAALKRLGVPHHYEVYPGNHGNRRGRGASSRMCCRSSSGTAIRSDWDR
jgi:enterochelin esterase-like enzyme